MSLTTALPCRYCHYPDFIEEHLAFGRWNHWPKAPRCLNPDLPTSQPTLSFLLVLKFRRNQWKIHWGNGLEFNLKDKVCKKEEGEKVSWANTGWISNSLSHTTGPCMAWSLPSSAVSLKPLVYYAPSIGLILRHNTFFHCGAFAYTVPFVQNTLHPNIFLGQSLHISGGSTAMSHPQGNLHWSCISPI